MKRTLGGALFGAALLAGATAGAASFVGTPSPSLSPIFGTLINFDDKPTGTVVGAGDYLGLGVLSITQTEAGIASPLARFAGTQSAPNYIGTGPGGERGGDSDGTGWDGTILFHLTGLASMVGIGVADSRGGPETISIYDSGFNLLESFVVPTGANVYAGFSRATADIAYFQVTGDFFAVDDFQHNAPEPGVLWLLGVGALALAGSLRKRGTQPN